MDQLRNHPAPKSMKPEDLNGIRNAARSPYRSPF